MSETGGINTPDQRRRVFVSSTAEELASGWPHAYVPHAPHGRSPPRAQGQGSLTEFKHCRCYC